MKKVIEKMPEELRRITELFEVSGISYLLFKCEHILEGQNKNMDVLLRTLQDYESASRLLEQQGYMLYLNEKVEKYKKMYVLFDEKVLSAVHLHREISWHGVIVLDKEKVFERARGILLSPEDFLVIHAAHALFENFRVTEQQRLLLEKYAHEAKEGDYLNAQLSAFGWKKAFSAFIREFSVRPSIILQAYLGCLWKRPSNAVNLLVKIARALQRKTSLSRKGYLIALVGMNGSGKSSTKEALLQKYAPFTNFVAGQQGYYFGWEGSFFGKILSLLRGKGKKRLFDAVSEEKVKKFDFFQELLFLYISTSFLFRYFTEVYPHLRKNKLVVTDRYFYDLWGQYPYSQKSKVLRFLSFPKPDCLILLDTEVETVINRDKRGNARRVVQPREKLEGQRKRYLEIGRQKKAFFLNAKSDFEENISTIINNTWRGFVKRSYGF